MSDERDDDKWALVKASRIPWHPRFEGQYGIAPKLWRSLVEDVWASAKTPEGVLRAWVICQQEGVDPYSRSIYVVPLWDSKINNGNGGYVDHIWYGIGFLRMIAHRTKLYAGNDPVVYGEAAVHSWTDFYWDNRRKVEAGEVTLEYPRSAQVTVYRLVDGQRFAYHGDPIRFMESYTSKSGGDVPNDRWQRAPWMQLAKCAEANALRKAFPEIGQRYIEDEMGYAPANGRGDEAIDVTPPIAEQPVVPRPTPTAKAAPAVEPPRETPMPGPEVPQTGRARARPPAKPEPKPEPDKMPAEAPAEPEDEPYDVADHVGEFTEHTTPAAAAEALAALLRGYKNPAEFKTAWENNARLRERLEHEGHAEALATISEAARQEPPPVPAAPLAPEAAAPTPQPPPTAPPPGTATPPAPAATPTPPRTAGDYDVLVPFSDAEAAAAEGGDYKPIEVWHALATERLDTMERDKCPPAVYRRFRAENARPLALEARMFKGWYERWLEPRILKGEGRA